MFTKKKSKHLTGEFYSAISRKFKDWNLCEFNEKYPRSFLSCRAYAYVENLTVSIVNLIS
jgi:hypothetical protein